MLCYSLGMQVRDIQISWSIQQDKRATKEHYPLGLKQRERREARKSLSHCLLFFSPLSFSNTLLFILPPRCISIISPSCLFNLWKRQFIYFVFSQSLDLNRQIVMQTCLDQSHIKMLGLVLLPVVFWFKFILLCVYFIDLIFYSCNVDIVQSWGRGYSSDFFEHCLCYCCPMHGKKMELAL